MKNFDTVVVMIALSLILSACNTITNEKLTPLISREKAQQCADSFALTENFDLSKYHLVSATHSSEWHFHYGLNQQECFYMVIVNENTGKVGMLPSKGKAQKCSSAMQTLTRNEAQLIAEVYAKDQGKEINEVQLMEAHHLSEWTFFYDGFDQTIGNHFWVMVNEETGEIRILPGK